MTRAGGKHCWWSSQGTLLSTLPEKLDFVWVSLLPHVTYTQFHRLDLDCFKTNIGRHISLACDWFRHGHVILSGPISRVKIYQKTSGKGVFAFKKRLLQVGIVLLLPLDYIAST